MKAHWSQKLSSVSKRILTPKFIIVQVADILLVSLFVFWMFGYIRGVIFIGYLSLYISVFIVREIMKIKGMISDAKTNKKKEK